MDVWHDWVMDTDMHAIADAAAAELSAVLARFAAGERPSDTEADDECS